MTGVTVKPVAAKLMSQLLLLSEARLHTSAPVVPGTLVRLRVAVPAVYWRTLAVATPVLPICVAVPPGLTVTFTPFVYLALQAASAHAVTVTACGAHVRALPECSIWKWWGPACVPGPHFGPIGSLKAQPLLFVTQLHGLDGVYVLQVMVCCTRPCQPRVMWSTLALPAVSYTHLTLPTKRIV